MSAISVDKNNAGRGVFGFPMQGIERPPPKIETFYRARASQGITKPAGMEANALTIGQQGLLPPIINIHRFFPYVTLRGTGRCNPSTMCCAQTKQKSPAAKGARQIIVA